MDGGDYPGLRDDPPTSGGVPVLEYIAAHRSLYILKQVLWLAPLGLTMVMFLAFYPVLSTSTGASLC